MYLEARQWPNHTMFKSFWLNCFLTRLPPALTLYINTVGAESSQSDKFSHVQIRLIHNNKRETFLWKLHYVSFSRNTNNKSRKSLQTALKSTPVSQDLSKTHSNRYFVSMNDVQVWHRHWSEVAGVYKIGCDLTLYPVIEQSMIHGTNTGLPLINPFISRARQCGACILLHTQHFRENITFGRDVIGPDSLSCTVCMSVWPVCQLNLTLGFEYISKITMCNTEIIKYSRCTIYSYGNRKAFEMTSEMALSQMAHALRTQRSTKV